MKLTEQRLREIVREQLISLDESITEGVKGYEVGPDLEDFNGMDFNDAQYVINDDDDYLDAADADDWKPMMKIISKSKYKQKLRKHLIHSDKDRENFAKWLSSGMHKASESNIIEGAPKMAKNVEAENIQDLMNRVANAQKGGGSGRYGKEFDKAKTKALRAIKDMITYSKIGR